MSALFRLLRQYLGLSQMRIGTAVGLGQGRMSEVINGIRKIRDVKVFERIADGLDMPDHARVLLGLTPRQITAPPPRSPAATSGQAAGLLRQITAAGRIDATVVRVLQGETDNIRLLDRRLGAPAVAGKLDAHIGQIETSLRYSLRPGNRQQLARALADASALAGWLLPGVEDADVSGAEDADGRKSQRPAGGCGGALRSVRCRWWSARCRCQSMTSLTAERAAVSSTRFLPAAKAATRDCRARLLTARG
jgi:transcriptional regulator with XRE-family HTH domain